jgi:two-component system, OmpR family, sensor histidine kinase KdpD
MAPRGHDHLVKPGELTTLAVWSRWAIALAGIAAMTAVGRLVHLNPTTIALAYLLVVLFTSIWGGLILGVAMSIVATGCYNFFFLPPVGTFTIADPANWIALGTFLVASIVASRLVVMAREEAAEADARRNDIEVLYNLSLDLFTATNRVGALGEAAGRALVSIGARGGGLVLFGETYYRQNVISWIGEKPDMVEDLVAGIGRHNNMVEIPAPFGRDVYLPLVAGGRPTGVLVARGVTAPRRALESVAALVALSVERERFIADNTRLQALKDSDALKTSLLRAVSHDLTTPLTAIILQIDAMKRTLGDPDALARVASVEAESRRLQRRIGNLLAMARLESGKFVPHAEATPAADLFHAARENLSGIRERRRFDVQVSPDCPDVFVDPSLALEMITNLIENADRASPPHEAIELVARIHPLDSMKVRLEILDRGPGLPEVSPDATARMDAEKESDVPSRGLGLEIARSLASASGGAVSLNNRGGGGAVARIDLPAAVVTESVVQS